jgi:hypothetical protein
LPRPSTRPASRPPTSSHPPTRPTTPPPISVTASPSPAFAPSRLLPTHPLSNPQPCRRRFLSTLLDSAEVLESRVRASNACSRCERASSVRAC